MFEHRVGSTPNSTAMWGKKNGAWVSMTWAEMAQRVQDISCGLHSLDLQAEERAAILCSTRPEWVCVDMGILCAAGCTTTLYPSNSAEECAFVLKDSNTRFCFAEDQNQAEKIRSIREELPNLERVIVIDGCEEDDFQISLEALKERGRTWHENNPSAYASRMHGIQSDQLATLIYTSGTTGPPKGVMLSHDNWIFESEAIDKLSILQPDDKHYLFLPLAHAFAKVLEIGFIRLGVPTVVDGDIDNLMENLMETRPTVVGAVPRVFEKAYNRIIAASQKTTGTQHKIFNWAMRIGQEVSVLRQAGKEPSGALAVQFRMADKLVFSKIKERFGGRIKYFVSGGAPLSPEIASFFHGADLLILEGYGLTESSAASFVNRPERYQFGTVGLPAPGVEIKIAKDGEILLGGRGIMKGYANEPKATARVLTKDGWLKTGDIGQLEDGFLRITDRKKDIIITAGGKNIAPQNFENSLKALSPWVSQVVMHGDKRPYCVALVSIDEQAVEAWSKENGQPAGSYLEMASNPAVHDLIWSDVEALNRKRAAYERVKKIAILTHEITQESGQLTPTLKVKRRLVEKANKKVLSTLYAG
jgi:long-chain acyl-CoA synthetase